MRSGRARAVLLAVAVWAAALAGCTPDRGVDGKQTQQATPTPLAVEDAAGDLRLRLEAGFALQAQLLAEAATAETAEIEPALTDSTRRLVSIVAEAYGDDDATAFGQAIGAYNAAYLTADREETAGAADEVAAQMVAVTGNALDPDDAHDDLRRATEALLKISPAAAERDFEAAYTARREAAAQMLEVGRAFAAAISEDLPADYPGPTSTGALELQSALRQLLGEHSFLTSTVTMRGAAGARDFHAAAAALNGNTVDLVAAVRSQYGDDADAFDRAWRRRIATLADYAVAAAGADAGRVTDVTTALRREDDALAAIVRELTGDTASRSALRRALERHDEAVLATVDAFVDKDLQAATEQQLRASERSSDIADLVAQAMVADRPEEFADR